MGPSMIATTTTSRQQQQHQQQHHVALGWVRHDEALTKMAASCWSLDRFTDVTIFCEDRVLHAHRLVLASMSPLLASLLSGAEGPETSILLPEVKGEDMRLLLQFIYQGEVVLPPRRTAALLDLAALLCIAGVRGGGTGHTPPSPPRSDTPELDPCDNREDHVSDDEHEDSFQIHKEESNHEEVDVGMEDEEHDDEESVHEANDNSATEETEVQTETTDKEDVPMNLASKPETKINDNCSRPKPCSSSPPDFTYLSASHTSGGTSFINRQMDALSRAASLSYYQHPALRGCHPFSLELAVTNHRNGARTPDDSWTSKRTSHKRRKMDFTDDSDAEAQVDGTDADYDSDREIDLSIKTDLARVRSDSAGEDKMSPTSDVDTSASNESDDNIRARNCGPFSSAATTGSDVRLNLANKMLLMPPNTNSNDPRRSYLEAVLQESLVQQSYTIVLPSHMGVTTPLPLTQDQLSNASSPALLSHGSLENKAWNLAGKTAAELQCLQGLLSSRIVASGDSAYSRSASVNSQDSTRDTPTNLSTNKNSVSSTKRNSREGYSCQVCRKVFTSSSNLAVHSMIHSGTKPFKCDMCSWSFRQKAHLQKHMRHIHKIIVAK